MTSTDDHRFRVLIAGGGIAGLEAALALRDLAADRLTVTMLTTEPDFVYRPLRVREPFGQSVSRRYPMEELAAEIGFELRQDAFVRLDHAAKVVHTESEQEIGYDALLLALGARAFPRFRHALTLDDRRLDEQLHGLIQDVEEGYVHKLAFILPSPAPWPLPLYELALMTARRAFEMNAELSISLVTPEDAPLAVFGAAVSEAVTKLLEENGILTITSAHAETPERGHVALQPGPHDLHVDRIIAMPQLFGPSTPGLPKDGEHGFIEVDACSRVRGVEGVYAAGDATDFPLKFGGIAAQQADVAARAIAAAAGVPVTPEKLDPEVHGVLLGGGRPLYLSARITGGHGTASRASDEPRWSAAEKISTKYLAPFIEGLDRAARR